MRTRQQKFESQIPLTKVLKRQKKKKKPTLNLHICVTTYRKSVVRVETTLFIQNNMEHEINVSVVWFVCS